MYNQSQTLDVKSPSHSYPIVPKRTWKLTIDNPQATGNEAFFAIQVNFSGASAIEVAVISGTDSATRVNPVIVPYSGAIVPVSGIGYATSGTDAYDTTITTSGGITDVIAFGGDKVGF